MLAFIKIKLFIPVVILVGINMVSCTAPKKVVYFYDLKDSTLGSLSKTQVNFEAPIQKNDQLSITVGGSNIEDLAVLNSANGNVAGGTTSTSTAAIATGYLVEADGKIQIPYIGKVQALGLTRLQLQDTLTALFNDYTKNPVVNVRFMNYNFSVLGEVKSNGRFTMPNERTTILEAISMAGDLTEFGMRNNVLVIREENGERNFARVDLLSKDLFTSPYFYLKTNDVVYVQAVKSKFIARTGIPQYLGIVAVAVSLLLSVIAIIN